VSSKDCNYFFVHLKLCILIEISSSFAKRKKENSKPSD
jgi:hypothetical protein